MPIPNGFPNLMGYSPQALVSSDRFNWTPAHNAIFGDYCNQFRTDAARRMNVRALIYELGFFPYLDIITQNGARVGDLIEVKVISKALRFPTKTSNTIKSISKSVDFVIEKDTAPVNNTATGTSGEAEASTETSQQVTPEPTETMLQVRDMLATISRLEAQVATTVAGPSASTPTPATTDIKGKLEAKPKVSKQKRSKSLVTTARITSAVTEDEGLFVAPAGDNIHTSPAVMFGDLDNPAETQRLFEEFLKARASPIPIQRPSSSTPMLGVVSTDIASINASPQVQSSQKIVNGGTTSTVKPSKLRASTPLAPPTPPPTRRQTPTSTASGPSRLDTPRRATRSSRSTTPSSNVPTSSPPIDLNTATVLREMRLRLEELTQRSGEEEHGRHQVTVVSDVEEKEEKGNVKTGSGNKSDSESDDSEVSDDNENEDEDSDAQSAASWEEVDRDADSLN
ncbi:hypothetical protein VTL71DRAFT_9494 [Oculimacula yallundae]|uniref:Uncharacterized protein n=1 Tax=Oculimacula yallundae TaxID=86028 RepID=A0ABR4BS28_9HELO